MFRPQAILTLSFLILAGAAIAADPPPAPQKTTPTATQSTPKPAGAVVFIDPATGQIRQPDASEIGGLVSAPAAPGVAPRAATEPAVIQGANGAVGMKIGEDKFAYAVATIAPDGTVSMDCVTGSQNAAKRADAKPAPAAETKTRDSRNDRNPR